MSHDRELQLHNDRVSKLVVFTSEALKKEITDLRTVWRDQDKARRQNAVAGQPLPPHALGSLRSLLFASVFEHLRAKLQEGTETRTAFDALVALSAAEVDRMVFRFKHIKFEERKEGTPWGWMLVFSLAATPTFIGYFDTLGGATGIDSMRVGAMHSRDGALSQYLRGGTQQRGAPAMAVDDDGDDSTSPAQRQRLNTGGAAAPGSRPGV